MWGCRNTSLPSTTHSFTCFAESGLDPRGVKGPRLCARKHDTGIDILMGLCPLLMFLCYLEREEMRTMAFSISIFLPHSKILTTAHKALMQSRVRTAGLSATLRQACLQGWPLEGTWELRLEEDSHH